MFVCFIIKVISFLPWYQAYFTRAISFGHTKRILIALEELSESLGKKSHFLFIYSSTIIIGHKFALFFVSSITYSELEINVISFISSYMILPRKKVMDLISLEITNQFINLKLSRFIEHVKSNNFLHVAREILVKTFQYVFPCLQLHPNCRMSWQDLRILHRTYQRFHLLAFEVIQNLFIVKVPSCVISKMS